MFDVAETHYSFMHIVHSQDRGATVFRVRLHACSILDMRKYVTKLHQ